MQQFRFSLSALSLGIALGLGAPAFADTLQKPALDQLAAAWKSSGKAPADFNAFLT